MLERIQGLCATHGITLTKLERDLGFGRGSLYKWGKSSPTTDNLRKVAAYFKVSTDYLLYGFENHLLTQLIQYVKDDRTYEQFAEDTGVDLNELMKIGMGLTFEPPALDTIEKIADNNPVEYLVSKTDLLQAAGYMDEATANKIGTEELKKRIKSKQLALSKKDERDIAVRLEQLEDDLTNQQTLMLSGEVMDDETRELLKSALEHAVKLSKLKAKNKFNPTKNK